MSFAKGTKMRKSKLETAKNLAHAHFKNEPNLKHIRLLEPLEENDPREPIKLLEVVEGTIERGIEPIAFPADPARGIDYPVLIVEISPREYKNIEEYMPHFKTQGWTVGSELSAN
jgi:hypothetical protein